MDSRVMVKSLDIKLLATCKLHSNAKVLQFQWTHLGVNHYLTAPNLLNLIILVIQNKLSKYRYRYRSGVQNLLVITCT